MFLNSFCIVYCLRFTLVLCIGTQYMWELKLKYWYLICETLVLGHPYLIDTTSWLNVFLHMNESWSVSAEKCAKLEGFRLFLWLFAANAFLDFIKKVKQSI